MNKWLIQIDYTFIYKMCSGSDQYFNSPINFTTNLIRYTSNKTSNWAFHWYNDITLRWRHNEHDSVSNHQPHDCLLNRLFTRRSKKTSKLRVTGLCAGNSPEIGEFPAQRASNAENGSIWWRHHDCVVTWYCPRDIPRGVSGRWVGHRSAPATGSPSNALIYHSGKHWLTI